MACSWTLATDCPRRCLPSPAIDSAYLAARRPTKLRLALKILRGDGGGFAQPLLDHGPELEPYLRHPSTFPLVDDILGRRARFAQFDFRETPALSGFTRMVKTSSQRAYWRPHAIVVKPSRETCSGPRSSSGMPPGHAISCPAPIPSSRRLTLACRLCGAQGFHHDRAEPDRFLRPAGTLPIDYLCTIHYLTDVDQSSPVRSLSSLSSRSPHLALLVLLDSEESNHTGAEHVGCRSLAVCNIDPLIIDLLSHWLNRSVSAIQRLADAGFQSLPCCLHQLCRLLSAAQIAPWLPPHHSWHSAPGLRRRPAI